MQRRASGEALDVRATPDAEQAINWCGKCGIPYAATMTHCSLCGAPLAADPDPLVAAPIAPRASADLEPPLAQPTLTAVGTSPGDDRAAFAVAQFEAQLPPMPTLPSAASNRLFGRMRQRQHALSEDEVDAAAAAIIARARAEENLLGSDPLAREFLERSSAYLPDPKLAAALAGRQNRDRVWLIAGFVCSVVLILAALIISRYTSSGLLAR